MRDGNLSCPCEQPWSWVCQYFRNWSVEAVLSLKKMWTLSISTEEITFFLPKKPRIPAFPFNPRIYRLYLRENVSLPRPGGPVVIPCYISRYTSAISGECGGKWPCGGGLVIVAKPFYAGRREKLLRSLFRGSLARMARVAPTNRKAILLAVFIAFGASFELDFTSVALTRSICTGRR